MDTPHTITPEEKELIAVAVRQMRDRCNNVLNWLYPPPKEPEQPKE